MGCAAGSSNAISGVGTVFQRFDDATGTWTKLAEVNSISGPSMTRDFIDVTSLDSPGDYREFVSGFRPDNITATLEGHDEIDRKILEKCLVGSTPLKTVLSFSDTRLETEAIFTLISTYQPSKKWRAELFITNRVFNYQNA